MKNQDSVIQSINLDKLNFKFTNPPLLVGGMAMMYYGLRDSDKDIDLIISENDHRNLASSLKEKAIILEGDSSTGYKENLEFVDLFGDHGILIYEFEIWDNIMLLGYEELRSSAVHENDILVINLEKLLFLNTIRGVHKKRYLDDAILIAKYLSKEKYRNYNHVHNEYWKSLE